MEPSFSLPLQLQENFLFEDLLDKSYYAVAHDAASDPGYFSAGSSLSPTSSEDSFSFSPSSLQTNLADALDSLFFSSPPPAPVPPQEPPKSPPAKKSRSRYPGNKRQTASEREKLRMRDLTKALHHLRSYLPPSVAPAGQILTKIETLRLTIRYISFLSAQLGLSEEVLEQRRSSGCPEAPQTLSQFLGRPMFSVEPSYQAEVCFNAEQLWSPQQQQQQQQQQTFSGVC
ncbi:mesoderm posterior aa [Dunckerocampus dactyliophorus]|uniref:mesoderm posterior aa n=1 Tax=Dunckerocampus dactyliophorus TaxID=161453 RepID=UPI0024073D8F|nr:mesoderm posterior aa [Dunckerocampus dactyliophorus]